MAAMRLEVPKSGTMGPYDEPCTMTSTGTDALQQARHDAMNGPKKITTEYACAKRLQQGGVLRQKSRCLKPRTMRRRPCTLRRSTPIKDAKHAPGMPSPNARHYERKNASPDGQTQLRLRLTSLRSCTMRCWALYIETANVNWATMP